MSGDLIDFGIKIAEAVEKMINFFYPFFMLP